MSAKNSDSSNSEWCELVVVLLLHLYNVLHTIGFSSTCTIVSVMDFHLCKQSSNLGLADHNVCYALNYILLNSNESPAEIVLYLC